MDNTNFCFRICDPKGKNPAAYCEHIYDTLGCEWNMPANYDEGFDTCHADSGEVCLFILSCGVSIHAY